MATNESFRTLVLPGIFQPHSSFERLASQRKKGQIRWAWLVKMKIWSQKEYWLNLADILLSTASACWPRLETEHAQSFRICTPNPIPEGHHTRPSVDLGTTGELPFSILFPMSDVSDIQLAPLGPSNTHPTSSFRLGLEPPNPPGPSDRTPRVRPHDLQLLLMGLLLPLLRLRGRGPDTAEWRKFSV